MTDFEDEIEMAEQRHLPYRYYRIEHDPRSLTNTLYKAFGITDSITKGSDLKDVYDIDSMDQDQIDQDFLDYHVNTGGLFAQRPMRNLIHVIRDHSDSPEEMVALKDSFIGDTFDGPRGSGPYTKLMTGSTMDDRIKEAVLNKGSVFGDHAYIVTRPVSPEQSSYRTFTAGDMDDIRLGLDETGISGSRTLRPGNGFRNHIFPLNPRLVDRDVLEKAGVFDSRFGMKRPPTYGLDWFDWRTNGYMLKRALWDAVTPLMSSRYGGIGKDSVRQAVIHMSPAMKMRYKGLAGPDNDTSYLSKFYSGAVGDYDRLVPDMLAAGHAIGRFNELNGLKGGTPTFLFNGQMLPDRTSYGGYVSLGDSIRPIMVLDINSMKDIGDPTMMFLNQGPDPTDDVMSYTLPGISPLTQHEGMHIIQDYMELALRLMERLGLGSGRSADETALDGTGLDVAGMRHGLTSSQQSWVPDADPRLGRYGVAHWLYNVGDGTYNHGYYPLDEIIAYLSELNGTQDLSGMGISDGVGKGSEPYEHNVISGPQTADRISKQAFGKGYDETVRRIILNYLRTLDPEGWA